MVCWSHPTMESVGTEPAAGCGWKITPGCKTQEVIRAMWLDHSP